MFEYYGTMMRWTAQPDYQTSKKKTKSKKKKNLGQSCRKLKTEVRSKTKQKLSQNQKKFGNEKTS